MEQETTEMKVGRTLFIVTAECSPTATETVEQKLKKLINQHAFAARKVIRKSSDNCENPLAMCETKSEYGQQQTRTGRSSIEEETTS